MSYSNGYYQFKKEDAIEFRRQGIAEQIGRLCMDGIITDEEAKDIATYCMEQYEEGVACKELERTLRFYAQNLRNRKK